MKQRVVTGLIAAAVFVTLLIVGKLPYALAIMVIAAVGYYEFIKMHQLRTRNLAALIGFIAILYYVFPWQLFSVTKPTYEALIWMTMLLLFTLSVISKNKIKLEQIAIYVTGVVYIGLGTYYMMATRLLEDGLFWTFFVFVCIWLSDIGAYFSGWAMGKRLLWPAISPKKTIEGAIGAIIFTMLTAMVFALFAPEKISIVSAMIIGILISIIAQLGDLIQSAYKRAANVKDSGNFLPGHGGILDRTDSWLIVFPFIHLLSILPL